MTSNIFEGSRRIALLIAVAATIGTVISLSTYENHIQARYSTVYPAGSFVRMGENCPLDAIEHRFITQTSKGKDVSVELCVLAMSSSLSSDRNDERGNAPAIDPRQINAGIWKAYRNGVMSDETKKEFEDDYRAGVFTLPPGAEFPYTPPSGAELEKSFRIPSGDEDSIAEELSQKYRKNMMEGFGYLVAGLAIFGAVVWAIGWIARGFLGIPRGMDKRPN